MWQAQTNHKATADNLGYDYRHNSHCTTANTGYLHKLEWVYEILPKYEYVIWIDDDSYFTGFGVDDAKKLLAHPVGFFLKGRSGMFGTQAPPINSCFFGLRNCLESHKLLEVAKNLSDVDVKRQWASKDGAAYGGDQDRLWLGLKQLGLVGFASGPVHLSADETLNGRIADVRADESEQGWPKVLHLTGVTEKKWAKLRKLEASPLYSYGMVRRDLIERYPQLCRGQLRITAARLSQHSLPRRAIRLVARRVVNALRIKSG